MFDLSAALIISVGTTIYAKYEDLDFVLEDHFYTPATFVIVIGIIMLFVSLFGSIGALKESTCLVNIFGLVLSLVLVLELAAAITAYSMRGQMARIVDDRLKSTMPDYYTNYMVADFFNFMQMRLNCCGIDSYTDWAEIEVPKDSFAIGMIVDNITIPYSCCAEKQFQTVNEEQCVKLYANGCMPRLVNLVYQCAGLLGAGALTIAFIQIIGIMFAFSLASAIRKAKAERARRRWEIQERVINAKSSLYPHQPRQDMQPVMYVPFQGQPTA
ncbi:hypothetical protein ACJJTC_008519 [Scirpophaga incertulas]